MAKDTANNLISLIFSTKRVLLERVAKEERLNPFSLILRLETLQFINEKRDPPMRDIAAHLGITPPSATSLVHGMVKAGQLKRVVDDVDRRVIRLGITPSGKRTLEEGSERISKHIREVFLKLSGKDRADLIRIIKKIASLFELK